jgi:hypothetical protein
MLHQKATDLSASDLVERFIDAFRASMKLGEATPEFLEYETEIESRLSKELPFSFYEEVWKTIFCNKGTPEFREFRDYMKQALTPSVSFHFDEDEDMF